MIDPRWIRTTAFVVVIGATALFIARTRWAASVVAAVDELASRRRWAIFVCSALAFLGSATVAVLVRWPEPAVHDEFAYLLAADTFASGRLTNPTPEHWHHFETFYVLLEPTYASRFPPAQGALLALGLLIAGSPVVGLWLSAAAMAAAVCWALYGFVSERSAFLVGLALVCQICVTTYWTQSFWGGAVTAAAAAVVFGATARLLAGATRWDAVLLGVGLVTLANARPFEGAVVSIAPACLLVASVLRGRLAFRSLVPTIAVGVCGLVFMGAYNQVVVGSWWMPPYVEYERQYAQRPMFSFQERSEPKTYRHRELKGFFRASDKVRRGRRAETAESLEALERFEGEEAVGRGGLATGLVISGDFFLGRALVLPFLVGCLVCWKSRGGRFAVSGVVLCAVTLVLAEYFRVHYVAAAAAPVSILVAVGFDRLGRIRAGALPIGAALCAALLLATAMSAVLRAVRIPEYYEKRGVSEFAAKRSAVLDRLGAERGRDLVLVQYARPHDLNREWVYNRADIDGSEVVWARDMGAEANAGLLDYFSDRNVWTLRIDDRRNATALDLVRGPRPSAGS